MDAVGRSNRHSDVSGCGRKPCHPRSLLRACTRGQGLQRVCLEGPGGTLCDLRHAAGGKQPAERPPAGYLRLSRDDYRGERGCLGHRPWRAADHRGKATPGHEEHRRGGHLRPLDGLDLPQWFEADEGIPVAWQLCEVRARGKCCFLAGGRIRQNTIEIKPLTQAIDDLKAGAVGSAHEEDHPRHHRRIQPPDHGVLGSQNEAGCVLRHGPQHPRHRGPGRLGRGADPQQDADGLGFDRQSFRPNGL